MSTTPATTWPFSSTIPEAVRNSVSMRSLMTGARAGMMAFNSVSLAVCQAALAMGAHKARQSASATLIKMNDPALQRGGGRLGAVGHAEFAQQAVDVGFDRGLGNTERPGNLLVAVAADNQLQYLGFARGQ